MLVHTLWMALLLTEEGRGGTLMNEELVDLINAYRVDNGLSSIPYSKAMMAVATRKLENMRYASDVSGDFWDPDLYHCNLHTWWDVPDVTYTTCCYTSDHAESQCMWDKPEEICGDWPISFTGNGYEISAYGQGTIEEALSGWQGSAGHNDVILSQNGWEVLTWRSLGCGADEEQRQYHCWFSDTADSNPYVSETYSPTVAPVGATNSPSFAPSSNSPTRNPTSKSPTSNPTGNPTNRPTGNPSSMPSRNPTNRPTGNPTGNPTKAPTAQPTDSESPTKNPTTQPTGQPSRSPTSTNPTLTPTSGTSSPTSNTGSPTHQPTPVGATPYPSSNPSSTPSLSPSAEPTQTPSLPPGTPTTSPTTANPSTSPTTANPSSSPSQYPSASPTVSPTELFEVEVEMDFELFVNESRGTGIDVDDFNTTHWADAIHDIVITILELTNPNITGFDYFALNFELVVQCEIEFEDIARTTIGTFEFDVDMISAISMEEEVQELEDYFNSEDFQTEFLTRFEEFTGYTIVTITIEAEAATVGGSDDDDGSSTDDDDGTVDKKKDDNEEAFGIFEWSIIAGVALVVILIIVLGVIWWVRRKGGMGGRAKSPTPNFEKDLQMAANMGAPTQSLPIGFGQKPTSSLRPGESRHQALSSDSHAFDQIGESPIPTFQPQSRPPPVPSQARPPPFNPHKKARPPPRPPT